MAGNSSFRVADRSETNDLTFGLARFKDSAIGQSGLNVSNGQIQEELCRELVFPHSIQTYKKMVLDASVASAKDLFEMMIRRVPIFAFGEPGNEEQVKNAEYINWQLSNLEDQTFRQVMNEVLTYDWAGFSLLEMVFEKVKDGEHAGKMRVKRFEPRSQDSISRWLYGGKENRTLKGVEQNISSSNAVLNSTTTSRTVGIPIKKLVHFAYNSTKQNPEGRSPLIKVWVTWRYKCLLEEYESTGIIKDMAGMPVFGLPKDVIVRAQNDPSSDEATLLNYHNELAKNMHAGEQNFACIPIEYNDQGKPLYSFALQGVEGGNKNYDVNAVINRRQNEILMAYFADILKIGTGAHGSFSLADSKATLLAHSIEDHLQFITNTFQKDFVKLIAEMEGWEKENIPELRYGAIEARDLDEFSKGIQRVGATGLIPKTPEIISWILKNIGYEGHSEFSEMEQEELDDLLTDNVTRSGDGMKSGLPNGTGNSNSGRDDSTANKESA